LVQSGERFLNFLLFRVHHLATLTALVSRMTVIFT
jgi:hypothetical protein